MKLTEKQKRFADYYIETGNATESARKAGYKKPHVQGSQNLEKLSVRTYIDERLKQMDSERIATAEEVMKYLTGVMRGETQSEVVVVENIGDFMSEARTMNKAPDEKERLKAAELIGKRYGIWTDKQNIEVQGAVTFLDDIGDDDET
ncbi:terminase small subunit [Bacillus sp. JJ722]|uniref:terminase small subunit n=1 Tax=Bacillus sp. JJ722 TaxID=3122973 RepID=UPI002FFFF485